MQNPTSTSLTLPKLTAEHVWEKIGPKVRIQLAMAAALDGLTPSARELVFLKSPEAARVLGEDEKELQKARKRRRDIESAREDARAAGKPLPDFDPLDLESLPRMSSCLDCGRAAAHTDTACKHCGGKLAGRDRRGLLWTAAAVGTIAARAAARSARRALRIRRAAARARDGKTNG